MSTSQKKYRPLCRPICHSDVLLSLRQRSQYALWNADKCRGAPWSAKWLIRHKTDSMWSLDSTQLMWLLDSSLFFLLHTDSEFLCGSSTLTPSLELYYPLIHSKSCLTFKCQAEALTALYCHAVEYQIHTCVHSLRKFQVEFTQSGSTFKESATGCHCLCTVVQTVDLLRVLWF